MTTLREAAQQALDALEISHPDFRDKQLKAITALRVALAEPEQEPEQFDHGIGDDRFKVVRGAYWWHVLIGDSPTKRGKFHTQAGAEEMAALLLREFRNGAFVQHKAALAEPTCKASLPVEPVAWMESPHGAIRANPDYKFVFPSQFKAVPLYTAPPQRKPLTDEELSKIIDSEIGFNSCVGWEEDFARAIERAHGIGGNNESA